MKRFVIEKIENALITFTVEDLVAELDRVYRDIHGEENEKSDEEKKEDDAAYAGFTKQFKGMCRNCGKLGHMARDCKEKTKTEMEEETLTIEEEDLEEVEEDSKEEAMEETTTIEETMDNRGLEENVFTVELPDTKKWTVERRKQKKSERTKR